MITLVPATRALAVAVVTGQPLNLRHAPDWPHADTADALRPLAEHPEHTGEGTFLITQEQDRIVVGDCGWFGPPDADGLVDLGYGVAPSARRRGVGTAAVGLLLRWVHEHGARRARAEVLPGNEASLRLLDGLGFVREGVHAGHLVLVRDLDHIDW